jgi:hypothetical protein
MGGNPKMRFAALLKKELRQALPWMLLALIALLFFGSLIIQSEQEHQWTWNANNIKADSSMSLHSLDMRYPLYEMGGWLIAISIALAVALGVTQFLLPFFQRNWAYTIHRSVNLTTILLAKFTAAAIAMVLSIGVIWTLLYQYACQPGMFPFPPSERVLLEGWLFILMAMVIYFATALTAVSPTKWYTTRVFPLVFTLFVYIIAFSGQTPLYFVIIALIAATGFCVQTIHTFTNREF